MPLDDTNQNVNSVPEPMTEMDATAIQMHEVFASFLRAGFTRGEALDLLLDGMHRHVPDEE